MLKYIFVKYLYPPEQFKKTDAGFDPPEALFVPYNSKYAIMYNC